MNIISDIDCSLKKLYNRAKLSILLTRVKSLHEGLLLALLHM